ncbi:MAG: CpsD/CapB family tyrosine-protein kinase [Planctomycetes bacterium]|nr:CpsD/CapB family tyrosine-protein kinase [Planctomycetota bacterium]
MGTVYDAMRKHEREEPGKGPPDPAASAPDAQTQTPDPPEGRQPYRPQLSTNGYAPELVAYCNRGGRLAEEYRALRTNLLAQYEHDRFCTLITSAEAGEGKTVTSLNLGFVLAELPDHRTIVVDCDLHKGTVHRLLGMPMEPGLADVLRGQATLEEVIRPTTCENLFAIPSGKVDQDEVGHLLSRPELEELIRTLRRDYDYVLLDTPPIRVAGSQRRYGRSISYSTAGILGRTTRDAILVVRMNKTRRESIEAAIRQLNAANVRAVGVVLTHQRHHIPEFLYRMF